MEISPLQWREPLWLILLGAPWLLFYLRSKQLPYTNRLKRFADPKLWPWLITGHGNIQKRLPPVWTAVWILGIVSLAGPFFTKASDAQSTRQGVDIAIIVDISPSMQVADITPNRLARSKLELRDFIKHLGGDRVALIAFSANAYPVLPLTHDYDAFLHFSDALQPSLVTNKGSNLGQALIEAEKILDKGGKKGRAIILLSDGEIHSETVLEVGINNLKSPLFIIGTGTQSGGPIPDDNNRFMRQNQELIISHLQQGKLLSLTIPDNYTTIKNDDSDWKLIMEQLRQQTETNIYHTKVAQQQIPIYPWLLFFALSLLLYGGIRYKNLALAFVIIPLLSILPESVNAGIWQERKAHNALTEGDYQTAEQLYKTMDTYNGYMGLGAAYYRQQKWQSAVFAYQQAFNLANNDDRRAHAQFNKANSLSNLRQFEQAKVAYQNALYWKKNYKEAALNLSLIEKMLAMRGDSSIDNDHSPQNEAAQTGPVTPDIIGKEQINQREILIKAGQQMNAFNDKPEQMLKYIFKEHDRRSLTISRENPW